MAYVYLAFVIFLSVPHISESFRIQFRPFDFGTNTQKKLISSVVATLLSINTVANNPTICLSDSSIILSSNIPAKITNVDLNSPGKSYKTLEESNYFKANSVRENTISKLDSVASELKTLQREFASNQQQIRKYTDVLHKLDSQLKSSSKDPKGSKLNANEKEKIDAERKEYIALLDKVCI